ncbi:MAG: alpha/beta hydrolase [Opitutaceae bacterium]|jgi:pimeloyl-ACP methyl ester carboxylesterase
MLALLVLLSVALLLMALGLGFRAYCQHENAEILAIHTPNGIQEGMYVPIGGIEQWIQIRGEDRNNPVVLFVHGGPGGSTLMISSGWQPWEKYFTVVQWDQRGTGRTYRKTSSSIAPTMTVDRMTQDGIEVAEFLRTHLHRDKIILVGHSWGSFLGIHMVKKRPDLFFAYVGTGQFLGSPTWKKAIEIQSARVLASAQATNNAKALKELAATDALPDGRKFWILQKWARQLRIPFQDSLDIKSKIPPTMMPGFTLLDWYYYSKGFRFSLNTLLGPNGPLWKADLRSLGLDFAIPIFFFEGTSDHMTPIEPAEQYFKEITAPHREFVRFEGANHFLPLNRPDDFLKELLARVRPLADPPK